MEQRKIKQYYDEDKNRKKKKITVANDRITNIEARKRIRAKKRNKNILIAVLSFFCAVMSIQVIMNYTQIAQVSTTISEIENQIELKESERDGLVSKLEPYKATTRIEQLAKLNLGMDYPRGDQIVNIDVEKKAKASEIITEKEKSFMDSILSALGHEE